MTTRIAPGPAPAHSLIEQLRALKKFNGNFMPVLAEWGRQYGDIYVFEVGKLRQFIVSHPDYVHEVTVAQASKFYKDDDYKNPQKGLARFLGNGILTSDGEFWKRQRKLVAPAFHAKRIGSYADTMVAYARRVTDSWRDNMHLDMSDQMMHLTVLIVAKTLFDAEVDADVQRTAAAVDTIQRFSSERTLLPTWIPTPRELAARRARRDLDAIIYRIIKEWRLTGEDKGDLLSMLLLARDDDGKGMTDQQARDEVATLFLAGHETTSNLLTWTWYLLAKHPEVEAKLHDELDTVLGGQPPTLADLDRLPYTDMVIKESMRIYPPVWGFSREAMEDVEIDGYLIPKGCVVGAMTYLMHHDARWFTDPERFDPDRFSAENEKNVSRRAYLPFSGGPRVCVGNSFALMEARLILATIASRFQLTLAPGYQAEILPQVTLSPKGGLPMTIRVREPRRPTSSETRGEYAAASVASYSR
jgi:cytochrome P450